MTYQLDFGFSATHELDEYFQNIFAHNMFWKLGSEGWKQKEYVLHYNYCKKRNSHVWLIHAQDKTILPEKFFPSLREFLFQFFSCCTKPLPNGFSGAECTIPHLGCCSTSAGRIEKYCQENHLLIIHWFILWKQQVDLLSEFKSNME